MTLIDGEARGQAVAERSRNVIVDAGAGTGKTTLLVSRFLELVAPTTDAAPIAVDRIAAITFTRRASGHLRLSIRERVLSELAKPDLSPRRRRQLYEVLGGLDTAFISTTHSFADRMLRLRPVEARLSPDFHIIEDQRADALVGETFDALLHAAETGTLERWLEGSAVQSRAREVEETLLDAINAGILVQSVELEFGTRHGLSSVVAGFIENRDQPPIDPAEAEFDRSGLRLACDGLLERIAQLSDADDSPGLRWFRRLARRVEAALQNELPVDLWRRLVREVESSPPAKTKKNGFAGAAEPWALYKAFDKGTGEPDELPIRDRVLAPLRQWMARRLVRMFPVVGVVYERVKAAHGAVDQVDLLIKLRDLLSSNRDVRRYYQGLFDHLLVDEFQDTDPLQAEVVLYLCERDAVARSWRDVELASGKLTIVGDPKQSIYRFRRADVAMYDEVRGLIRDSGSALEVELRTCFRSTPELIEWGNQRFAEILGISESGDMFDAASGVVFHRPLVSGRSATSLPAVRAVRIDVDADAKVPASDVRDLEARALACELRGLVDDGELTIDDDGDQRPLTFGDIAVLTIETFTVERLFPAFDSVGIPYASAGGTLFLRDPLHRQFLLGLRALADPSDGVARAALLRPPFFAVDPDDLLAEKAGESSERAQRAREAQEWIATKRRDRFSVSPGHLARDLLEETAIGRSVASGPNGLQRLRRLRELCLVLEQTAMARNLDYDGVTSLLREWVESPIGLDPPMPIGGDAVRVMTIHQSKGLEFPVVALWDSRARRRARSDAGAWRIDRNGGGWQISLANLSWEEPTGLDLKARELRYRHAERQRLIYVAATRARDLVILPRAPDPKGQYISTALLGDDSELVVDAPARAAPPPSSRPIKYAADLDIALAARWQTASQVAHRPRFTPTSVTAQTKGGAKKIDVSRQRHGAVFGDTVHLAISLCLRHAIGAKEAVRRAVLSTGLGEFVAQAAVDVGNALSALSALGLPRICGSTMRSEYPVFAQSGTDLVAGTIDLLAIAANVALVIDFKTDPPPKLDVETEYPIYADQVRLYADMVERLAVAPITRSLLIFTAAGTHHEVSTNR